MLIFTSSEFSKSEISIDCFKLYATAKFKESFKFFAPASLLASTFANVLFINNLVSFEITAVLPTISNFKLFSFSKVTLSLFKEFIF